MNIRRILEDLILRHGADHVSYAVTCSIDVATQSGMLGCIFRAVPTYVAAARALRGSQTLRREHARTLYILYKAIKVTMPF